MIDTFLNLKKGEKNPKHHRANKFYFKNPIMLKFLVAALDQTYPKNSFGYDLYWHDFEMDLPMKFKLNVV